MAFVKYLVMLSVMCLMLGVGLRTALSEVLGVVRQVGPLLRGVAANFLVVPAVFYLALHWGPFSPDVVIGLLIMAAVPVAPMAPPFVAIAKGDVPYAVGLMTVVALLCVPLTPLILGLSLPTSEEGLELDSGKIVQTLLAAQLVPIGVGMAVRQVRPKWAGALGKFIPRIGQVGLAVSVAGMLIVQGGLIVGLGVLPNLAALLAIVVCLAVGALMMIGQTPARRRSLGISTAIRNVALGLLIVNSNYAGTPAVAVVLVFGIASMGVAFLYARLAVHSRAVTDGAVAGHGRPLR